MALAFSCLVAFAGLPLLALASLLRFRKTRLSTYNKGARQLSLLGLVLGWILLVALRVWLFCFPASYLEYCWMGLVAAVLVQSIHFAFWQKTAKQAPGCHLGLVSLHVLLAMTVTPATILLLRAHIHALAPALGAWGTVRPLLEAGLLATGTLPLQATVCALALLAALAVPASWSAFCLPLFKKYQDFGRDHYKTMLTWCATWAKNAWLVLWLVNCALTLGGLWLLWQQHAGMGTPIPPATIAIAGAWQVVWLIPVFLWNMVCKSEQPLRHKIALFAALAISISLY